MEFKRKLLQSVFSISCLLVLISALLITFFTVNFGSGMKEHSAPAFIELPFYFLGLLNWIILPLSIILLYLSLKEESKFYGLFSLSLFVLLVGVLFIVNTNVSNLNLDQPIEDFIKYFSKWLLYLIVVPTMIMTLFLFYELIRFIKNI